MLKNRYFALVIFAAAILFSMVREWNSPIACVRPLLEPHSPVHAR
jgi:hypothetical protein